MANNVTVKDGAAANTVFKTTDTASVHTPHHNVDVIAAGASVDIGAVSETAYTGSGSKGLNGVLKGIYALLTGWLTVGGKSVVASANFTRPANTTPYDVGDLVANSTTAGSVTKMSFTIARVAAGSGMIRRVRLRKTGTSLTNATFRLHLYSADPTVSNGDNAAWLTTQSATYLGALEVTTDRAFTDGAVGHGVPLMGGEINFALASGQVVYGVLEARGAYTPISGEVFTLDLEVLQN